eukprot:Skav216166  [mRNA]  locus=scaffold1043:61074:61274:+ [translate_table: standard]
MNDISLTDFHLRFVDNLESVSDLEQQDMLLDPGKAALGEENLDAFGHINVQYGSVWFLINGQPIDE